MAIRDWIREREIAGVTMFSYDEVIGAFPNLSLQVVNNALSRLKRDRRIYSPYKSFYVTLAPQYVARGSVPPYYYMDELMRRLGRQHYFGLLSAASIWGASHQRSQVDFVFLTPPRLTAPQSERRRVEWLYRTSLPEKQLCQRNSEAGVVRYSNAELTALELVQYERHVGGLPNVCTVLAELLESTDFSHAAEGVFSVVKDTTVQRLGYLVENVLHDELQAEIIYHEWTRRCPYPHYLALSTRSDSTNAPRNERWNIIVNTEVEIDEL